MAPTFNDKSIQGIIDIIHSELGCLGSVTDKSIQGIVDKANAAGANVTDKSIQGIIDKLGPFSCLPLPTSIVLNPAGYYSWDPQSLRIITGGPHGNQSLLVSDSYGPSITGFHTGAGINTSQYFVAMISFEVYYGGILQKKFNQPTMGSRGHGVPRQWNNEWVNGGSFRCYDLSYGNPTVQSHTMSLMTSYWNIPTVWTSQFSGASATFAGTGTVSWMPDHRNMIPYLPVGSVAHVKMRSAALIVSHSTDLSQAAYCDLDLFKYPAGSVYERAWDIAATATAANVITSAGTHNNNLLMLLNMPSTISFL